MTDPPSRNRRWAWWAAAVLGAAAVPLGFTGFLLQHGQSGWTAWHAAALQTIQLFMLEVGPGDLQSTATRVASVLAPLATAVAALAAFGSHLQRWYRTRRLQRWPADHLFIGGGQTAQRLALGLLSGRKADCQVALLDQRGAAPLAAWLRQHKPQAAVLVGDALSAEWRARLNIQRARRLWITLGDDKRNLAFLRCILAEANLAVPPSPQRKPHWMVEVNHPGLLQVLPRMLKAPVHVTVECFSLPRLAARRLVKRVVNDILPRHPELLTGGQTPHLCVMGSGPLAQAVVEQAVRQLVLCEDPAKSLRLTWVAPDAEAVTRMLLTQHPALDPLLAGDQPYSDCLPLARLRAVSGEERLLTPAQWSALQASAPFMAVVLACDDQTQNVGALLRCAALRDQSAAAQGSPTPVPLLFCHPGTEPPQLPGPIAGLWSLPTDADLFEQDEDYPGERDDLAAKQIHASYAKVDPCDRQRVEKLWLEAAESDRWSSRWAADHAGVKQAISAVLVGGHALQERLRALEHRRYLVERLLDDWLADPDSGRLLPSGLTYKQRKAVLHLNETLVPYNRLSETQRAAITWHTGPACATPATGGRCEAQRCSNPREIHDEPA